MNKLLLTTTALITLVAAVAEAAPKKARKAEKTEKAAVEHEHMHKHHAAFKIDLHGRQEFNLAVRSVKKDYMIGDYATDSVTANGGTVVPVAAGNRNTNGFLTKNQKNFAFDSNTKLNLEVSAHSDNGMKYGANVALKPAGREMNRNFSSMDKTFLFLEGGFGRVEAGSNYSAVTMMEIGADSVATATGGVGGYWSQYANIVDPADGANATDAFILAGRNTLYRDDLTDTASAESSRKLTYMSPKFSGLQLGVSYTPDYSNKGGSVPQTPVAALTATDSLKNVWGAVLGYDHKMSGVDFAGEVHYQGGKNTSTTDTNNLSEWGIGGKVAKGPMSLAASYGDARKSNVDKTYTSVKNNYWTVGLGYEMNKLAASVTYLSGKKGVKTTTPNNMSKTQAWSLGLDYMLASGLKTYAEFTNYSLKNDALQTGGKTANKGNVFLAGAVVKF